MWTCPFLCPNFVNFVQRKIPKSVWYTNKYLPRALLYSGQHDRKLVISMIQNNLCVANTCFLIRAHSHWNVFFVLLSTMTRTRWLYPLQRGKNSWKRGMSCVWQSASNSETPLLAWMDYLFIVITPMSTLTRSSSTC